MIENLEENIEKGIISDYRIYFKQYVPEEDKLKNILQLQERHKKEEGSLFLFLVFKLLNDCKNAYYCINRIGENSRSICLLKRPIRNLVLDNIITTNLKTKNQMPILDKFIIYYPCLTAEELYKCFLKAWDYKFDTTFGIKQIYLIYSNIELEKGVIDNFIKKIDKNKIEWV
jgi:hypothetical protein